MTDEAQRQIVAIEAEAVVPTVRAALQAQGIPPDAAPNRRTLDLAYRAAESFRRLARPIGVWASIPLPDFDAVFSGEGRNATATPVADTASRADDLGLFAVTVGRALPRAISELFDQQNPALASMLDAYASEGVERAADTLEKHYVGWLTRSGRLGSGRGALRYSPGYCGWHVSGQRSLFAYLEPEEVGISLRESCLMQPLKSISGVVIAGRQEIFDFENSFDFCDECSTWTCRERINAVLSSQGEARDGTT